MGQDLLIFFLFFLLLWKFLVCLQLGFVVLLVISGTLVPARWGFLWQNKKLNRRGRQLHPRNLLSSRILHLFLSLLPRLRCWCRVIPGICGLDRQGVVQVEGVVGITGLAGRVVVYAGNPCSKAI